MCRLHKLVCRMRALLQKRKPDAQRDQGDAFAHPAQAAGESGGWNVPQGSALAALRQFGWFQFIKKACGDQWGVLWLEDLRQDFHKNGYENRNEHQTSPLA